MNLSAHYRVKDPVQVRAELGNGKDYLYCELQFGLRQAVGSRGLDELLAELRLKELEALEKVTGKIDKLTVFGGLEGVLNGLVSLRQA